MNLIFNIKKSSNKKLHNFAIKISTAFNLTYLIFTCLVMNQTFAAIGGYLLVGTTVKNDYLDSKYVSFKDKSGYSYRIPRAILSKEENAKLSKEDVVVYKEVDAGKYLTYRKECEDNFKAAIHKLNDHRQKLKIMNKDSLIKRMPPSEQDEKKRVCL